MFKKSYILLAFFLVLPLGAAAGGPTGTPLSTRPGTGSSYFASPGTLGSNAFLSFFNPVHEAGISNYARLGLGVSHDFTAYGDRTQTLTFQGEYPVGTSQKKFASIQVEGLFEKYRFSDATMRDWSLNQQSGSEGGDLNFRAKALILDSRRFSLLLNLLMKTTSGSNLKRRFSDTAGGSGYVTAQYKLMQKRQIQMKLTAMAGFGGWDDNIKDQPPSQNDLFHYGASLEALMRNWSCAMGASGVQGWRGNGDQVIDPYLECRVKKGQVSVFARADALLGRGVQDYRGTLGVSVNIGKQKKIKPIIRSTHQTFHTPILKSSRVQ